MGRQSRSYNANNPISYISPLTQLRITLLLLFFPFIWMADLQAEEIQLPEMSDSSGVILSPEQERRLGEQLMRQIRRSLTIVDDQEIQTYVQSLGYRLLSHNSDNNGTTFHFFVINDPNINAFAAPGGYIGINTGLIVSSESEDELASVIAHEIAHITQHHLTRTIEKYQKLNIPNIAALLATLILSAQSGNPQLAQAAIISAQAGALQAQLNFSRAHEYEADRIGMTTLAKAGFDPRGMPQFFERLQNASRYAGNIHEFLSTHPVNSSRIADSRNRAEQFPVKKASDVIDYALVKAKIQLMHESNASKSVKSFAATLEQKQYTNEAAARYGYANALIKNGQYKKARVQINKLLSNDNERIAFIITKAKLNMKESKYTDARRDLERGLKIYPYNAPLVFALVGTLMETGDYKKAIKLLQQQILHTPASPDLYKLLADAEGKSGQKFHAHETLAEYYYLNGETGSAIEHLKFARKDKTADFYRSSRLEARLKQFESEYAFELTE